jgi:hypothetical protein
MNLDEPLPANLPDDWKQCLPTLRSWRQDLTDRISGHSRAGRRLRVLNRVLGGLNVTLAAVAATAMFAALNRKLENLSLFWQIVLTFITVAPAIATGLQREWNTAIREGLNVNLAVDCTKLRTELDYFLALPSENFKEAIREWHQRYRDLVSRSFYPRIKSD